MMYKVLIEPSAIKAIQSESREEQRRFLRDLETLPYRFDKDASLVAGNVYKVRLNTLRAIVYRNKSLKQIVVTNVYRRESSVRYYACFISHSYADKKFAQKLYDELNSNGFHCWLDAHEMSPGDDIYNTIDRGIRFSDITLLCCSKESLTSWWVGREIEKAFEKEKEMLDSNSERLPAIIPLNLDNYLFDGSYEGGKSKSLRSRLAADFTGWESDSKKFDDSLNSLINVLRDRTLT